MKYDKTIHLTLNGQKIEYSGSGKVNLLNWLRTSQKIKSVKNGCSKEGVCGACLVEINKKPKLSCSVLMENIDEANIMTIEGIPDQIRTVLGRAFVASGAVQCGFCSPGMLMRTNILLQKNPAPSREEVTNAIKPHLCRCTGYVKIVDAILLASEKMRKKEKINFEKTSLGKSAPKYQALDRALGVPLFIDDLEMDHMVFGALCFSEYPRAKILKIDTSKAEAMAGVIKALTAKDIPGKRHSGLNVKDWPVYIAEEETTAYIGDVLASVIAESEETARKGVDAIKVEYEVYEPFTDPESALESDIKLHEKGNVLKEINIRRGDNIEKIFNSSAHVVSDTFKTQMVEHAFLETESCVASYENNKLTVYSQSQSIYREREQIAEILDIKKEDVNIKFIPTGGAFGGKLNITVQAHGALAAYYLKQPVKIKLNRSESLRMHPKKHPMYMEYKLACDEEGKFTGLHARILGDTGAYASQGIPVAIKAATHAGGAYFIPNVDIVSKVVYTNNPVAGAMRGFGVSQVTFAIESLIDELCETAKFDKWEIRYKNALEQNLTTAGGDRLRKKTGLKKALDILKKQYKNSKFSGIACAIKNCGIGSGHPEISRVKLEVLENGKLKLYHGWNEMGQGIDTILRQLLREQIKSDEISEIEVVVATEHETLGGGTVANRGTFLAGNSLLDAAKYLKKDMKKHGGLKKLVGKTYDGEYICAKTIPINSKKAGIQHFAYSFAAQLVILSDKGKIQKIVAIHDSGRVINKNLFEGQVQGGVIMGLGYAMSENLLLDKGQIVNAKLGKLGLLRSVDVPEIEVIPIEIDDIDGPFGAKGVGEITAIPVAPAVASAYRAFDGQKRTELPLKPPEQ
ncbi:Selenium-dependent xanthine dehydrogenase [Candidatus Desulfarcum epimagneticum]|uniref:Selenium-dependent xanthine dehydrogenase n=1 Tax=uncultured Desulfobacteraceae bacterium TaxID=218296 RepID=A0A484HES0_9BACT|nr:Selenium-dependent xanthine dehydrogenase [uncultured Desulfobacteraceae bacterium]